MKRFILILTALCGLLAVAPSFAQDATELLRADLRANKTAILTQAMALDASQSDLFWPIYRQYEGELIKLNDQALALIKDYAANYESMTDVTAKDLLKRGFKIRESRISLLKKYSGQVEKKVSPMVAARWAQCEVAIQAAIDMQMASELPLMKK